MQILKPLMRKHNLTRDQVAKMLYQTPRAVYSWENRDRNMPLGLMELLLIKLDEQVLLEEFRNEFNR